MANVTSEVAASVKLHRKLKKAKQQLSMSPHGTTGYSSSNPALLRRLEPGNTGNEPSLFQNK